MNAAPKLVASRTVSEATWRNTEVTADIVGELTRRKELDHRPIYVFGSAELTDTLLNAGLVDELTKLSSDLGWVDRGLLSSLWTRTCRSPVCCATI